MTTVECITALFYEVDEQLGAIPKHLCSATIPYLHYTPLLKNRS